MSLTTVVTMGKIATLFRKEGEKLPTVFINTGGLIKDLIRGFLSTACRWVDTEGLEKNLQIHGDMNSQVVLQIIKKHSSDINSDRHRELFYKTALFGLWMVTFDPAYKDVVYNILYDVAGNIGKIKTEEYETDPGEWWINRYDSTT